MTSIEFALFRGLWNVQIQKIYPEEFVLDKNNLVDKAVSACYLFEMNEYECPTKKRKERYNITIKPVKRLVTSYGGTFPVSKEQTPLPSPESRPKVSDFSRQRSRSSISEHRRAGMQRLEESESLILSRFLDSRRRAPDKRSCLKLCPYKQDINMETAGILPNECMDQGYQHHFIPNIKNSRVEEQLLHSIPFYLQEPELVITSSPDSVPERDSSLYEDPNSLHRVQNQESNTQWVLLENL